MSKVKFDLKVNDDGTITIPAFAVRGLGLMDGDEIPLACPTTVPVCDAGCDCTGLFLSRCCGDAMCTGYSTSDDELNIPAHLMEKANIPAGANLTAVTTKDVIVLMRSGSDVVDELPMEIAELLCELEYGDVDMQEVPLNGMF